MKTIIHLGMYLKQMDEWESDILRNQLKQALITVSYSLEILEINPCPVEFVLGNIKIHLQLHETHEEIKLKKMFLTRVHDR